MHQPDMLCRYERSFLSNGIGLFIQMCIEQHSVVIFIYLRVCPVNARLQRCTQCRIVTGLAWNDRMMDELGRIWKEPVVS
jgi:hypothetical protein